MKKYRCASFFAGTGGIDIGFLQTSQCDIVYANEIDKYPIKTYEFNIMGVGVSYAILGIPFTYFIVNYI